MYKNQNTVLFFLNIYYKQKSIVIMWLVQEIQNHFTLWISKSKECSICLYFKKEKYRLRKTENSDTKK